MLIRFAAPVLILPLMLLPVIPVQGQEENEDAVVIPPQSGPLEYYRERGMIPEPNRLDRQKSFGPLTVSSQILTASGNYDVDLTTASRLENSRVVITNSGDSDIVNPWVVANNTRNWFSRASITAEAVGTETDEELRAFRIWDLVRRGRYHWVPAEAGKEIHSPVKYLNVYGYGFCDDSASVLECLWKEAGLASPGCWGLEGHVISEVYYKGGYHILDADLEVFYPLWDGTGAASYSQVVADRGLLDRLTLDYSTIYTSTNDNVLYANSWDGAYTMAMSLRPGESLERCHYNWGKHHDNLYHDEPPFYGNGRQTWTPDLSSASRSMPGFTSLTNLTWEQDPKGDVATVHPADSAQAGILIWRTTGAYVFVGGSLDLNLHLESGSTAQVHFKKANTSTWQLVQTFTTPQSGWTSVMFDSKIAPNSTNACYSYDLKVTLTPGAGATNTAVGLSGLSSTGEIQCNPRSLPALVPGKLNPIAATYSGSGLPQLEIQFEYELSDDLPAYDPPEEPVSPADDSTNQHRAPVLTWDSQFEEDPALWREVVVSWDPDGYHPVSPKTTWEGANGNSWQVPGDWLPANSTFYWRVREGGELSEWSEPWSFTTGTQMPVALSGWGVE